MGIAILKAQADSILQALSLCTPTKDEAAERWAMMASTGQRFSRAGACQAVDDTFRYSMFSRPTWGGAFKPRIIKLERKKMDETTSGTFAFRSRGCAPPPVQSNTFGIRNVALGD